MSPKPQKYTVIIGSYLFLALLFFSIFLLGWSYHSSVSAIDKEIESSFKQRHILCENILENQSKLIAIKLNHINSHTQFSDNIFLNDKRNTQKTLLEIQDSEGSFNLDFVFVSLKKSPVWADASSSLFDLEHILSDIVKRKNHTLEGEILRFQKDTIDITLLINSVPIIHKGTGKIMGRLYGGIILNDNLSLLEEIRKKTQANSIALFEKGALISATDRYDSINISFLKKAGKDAVKDELYSDNNIIASYHKIRLFENTSSVEVAMAISNKPFIDIKRKFQIKTIILFILSLIFFLISIIIIRLLTYPSIERLIAFSEDVTRNKTNVGYSPGRIIELNKIGRAMETMVAGLKKANKEFQREMEERKRTESSLEKMDQHLRTLIRTIPDLVWLKDKDGKYLFCNSKFERFFGSKEEEIVGKTDYDFVEKELADSFRLNDQKAIDNGGPRINEEEVIYADDGHKEILETIKTPVYGTHKELIGVLGIARDITGRKEHFNRFRTVMDGIDSLVYVADMETYEILFLNKYGKDIWGDITGKICWQTLQSGQTGPCSFCTNEKLLDPNSNTTRPIVWEFQNTVDNEWYECRDQAIRWMDGRMVRMEIATNITQRKEAETQKAALEEKLRQAQKMEAVGTIAGGVAHDFNNILGIILGNTELALDGIPEESHARSNLEGIKTASLRARDVIKQLLTFSRKTDHSKKVMDLNPLVEEAVKLLRSSIPRSITIKIDLPEGPNHIIADPTQIHQVLINLCTNAEHAMDNEGGTLTITLSRIQIHEINIDQYRDIKPGEYIQLAIVDTGHGITQETREKIFDPYFTTKEVGKGTGMGLSVVLGIVKTHNGAISVFSEPGEGTTFKVLLPAADNDLVVEHSKTNELPEGSEHILFVDDEKALADMAKMILEKLGYKVKVCIDPNDALRAFKNTPDLFDLVISDMTMPQLSGFQLSQRIKEIRPEIPILICTGHISSIDEERMKEAGISALALKPITMSEIAKLIRNVLDS